MDATQAARYINRAVMKPGWSVKAIAPDYYTTTVKLELTLDSVDSSTPPHYRKKLHQSTYNHLYVGDCQDSRDVYAKLIRLMVGYELHEWREFLRYQDDTGSWVAPFHPHRYEGSYDQWERFGDLERSAVAA